MAANRAMQPFLLAFLLALALLAGHATASEPVFRQRDASGLTVFSDLPPGVARTSYSAGLAATPPAATASCGSIGVAALDARAESWRERIRAAAVRHALDPALLEALIRVESCFDPSAVSAAGAQGLTQLMPDTARELDIDDPFEPEQNLDGGARYLARMLERYDDETLALAAYNAGPGNVDRHGGVPPFEETERYLVRIAALRAR